MSLSASLNAGVQGLAVNSTRLSAISDNIVNANTNGYKRTVTEFADVVIDGSNNARYTAGGVKSYIKRDINAVSTLEATNNATDVAISGNGFIAVSQTLDPAGFNPQTDSVQLAITGSFQEDAEGFLKNANGDYLLGWPLNPDGTTVVAQPSRTSFSNLEPINARIIKSNAVATENIKLSGPLPASATEVGADATLEIIHTEEYFDTIGSTNQLTYTLTPTVPVSGTSNEWTLDITDSATTANAGLVGSFTVTFNDATDANPGTIASVVPVVVGGNPLASATFDATTGEITLQTASSPLRTFIGVPNENNGLSQTGSLDVANIRLDFKDGAGYGEYKGIKIDEKGIVRTYFTNDQSRPIYQLPVITVANPNGLDPVGSQSYSITREAGSLTLSNSGTQLAGKVMGFALTKSSVDVAQELTQLIETQRAYSSNAKIIQTVDEMLQETTNLKR